MTITKKPSTKTPKCSFCSIVLLFFYCWFCVKCEWATHPIQYNTIQYNTIQYNTTQHNDKQIYVCFNCDKYIELSNEIVINKEGKQILALKEENTTKTTQKTTTATKQ